MKRMLPIVAVAVLAACSPAKNTDATATTSDGADNAVTTKADAGHGDQMSLDQKVMAALENCKKVEKTCGNTKAVGYFVFPDVTSVALGVGGGGGHGALVRDGQIDGYYTLGEGSVGLQAGVTQASYVVAVNDKASLEKYVKDGQWSASAGAGITVAKADANAQGDATNAKSILYVFNAEGLMADVKIGAMKIAKSDEVPSDASSAAD